MPAAGGGDAAWPGDIAAGIASNKSAMVSIADGIGAHFSVAGLSGGDRNSMAWLQGLTTKFRRPNLLCPSTHENATRKLIDDAHHYGLRHHEYVTASGGQDHGPAQRHLTIAPLPTPATASSISARPIGTPHSMTADITADPG